MYYHFRMFYTGCRIDNASCQMTNVVLKRAVERDRGELYQESKGRQSTHRKEL